LASGIGQVALWGDWRDWLTEHRAELAVDAEDIRRVASSYLTESGLTVGWSRPRRDRARGAVESPSIVTFAGPLPRPVPLPHVEAIASECETADSRPPIVPAIPLEMSRLTDYRPRRSVLSNGLRLIHERRPGTGVVALEFYVDAGILRENRPGLAYLTGRLLEEGTAARSARALAESIEDVGGALDVGATGVSLRVRAEDLPLALEIMAEMVMQPAFPEDAIDWTKRRVVSELEGDSDDPAFQADLIFRSLIYGTHPLGRDHRGTPRELARITREDVLEHHARFFVPDSAFLVAVGDFDSRELARHVNARFGGWASRGGAIPRPGREIKPTRPRVRRVFQPGEQVQIILGHLGIARNHPDHDALVVLDHVFGSGPGFSDRLSRIVRDELGLVYSIGGAITDSADLAPGMFRVAAAAMPDSADRVIAAVLDQIRAMHVGAFTDEEVERAQRYLAGSWVFDFQTVEQRAERLFELERWGLELDEPVRWPNRIMALTPRQVRKAARVHLHPDALSRVELGPIRRRGQRSRAECA
jgi:zinc protease